jgi:hypothetical protein
MGLKGFRFGMFAGTRSQDAGTRGGETGAGAAGGDPQHVCRVRAAGTAREAAEQTRTDASLTSEPVQYFIIIGTASVVQRAEFMAAEPEVWVRFTALPDFLRNNGSGTGSTQPREYN